MVAGQECLQERDARELGDATIAMMQLKDQAKLKLYLHLLVQPSLICSWHFSKIQDAQYFATVAEYFAFRSLPQWPHHMQSYPHFLVISLHFLSFEYLAHFMPD